MSRSAKHPRGEEERDAPMIEIHLPTHPTPDAMAEAGLDGDQLILMLRRDPEVQADMEDMEAFEKNVRGGLPLMRQVYAFGVAAERVRCARWLIAIEEKTLASGSRPTLPSLARELLEAALQEVGG